MPRAKRNRDKVAEKEEKQRLDRVNNGAWRNFNHNDTRQPPAKINVGEKEKVEYKADGTTYAKVMNGMSVDERIEFMKQVKKELEAKFPGPVGEEIRTMTESMYVINIPSQATMDQLVPLGIGPRPADLLDLNAQEEYKENKITYKKNFTASHIKYVNDCAAAKIHIMEERIVPDIMLSLDEVPAFIAAKAQYISMVKFLEELEKAVIDIIKVDDQIDVVAGDIEGIEKAIDNLTVKDEGDSLRYCAKIRTLIKQLKVLKVKTEAVELPGILNNATRRIRIAEIEKRIEKTIDGDNKMMFGIYEELLIHGINVDNQNMFVRRAIELRTAKDHAPFPRKETTTAGVTKVSGGISQMLSEFEAIIRRIKQDNPHQDVRYVERRNYVKPLNTNGSQPPNPQASQLHINNALIAQAQAIINGQITHANATAASQFMNAAQTALGQAPTQDPCQHCLHTLMFPKTAFKHIWPNCFYNPASKSYVGAAKTAEVLEKSKTYREEKQAQDPGRQRYKAKKK